MTWKHGTWLGIDTETTGLQPGKDRIVQVGMAQMSDGTLDSFEWFVVNPGIPIPAEASAVHGITDADVANAHTWDSGPANATIAMGPLTVASEHPSLTAAERLLDGVAYADALVAYNLKFDFGFLEAELGERWTEAIKGKPIIDPLVVVRFDDVGRYWRGKGRHKLEAVAARLGVELPHGKAHTAGYDAALALNVLDKVARYLPDDGAEATALIERERKRQDEGFQAWLSRQKAREAAQEGA
jgi:DNA polymerase-3 subunit epsilon